MRLTAASQPAFKGLKLIRLCSSPFDFQILDRPLPERAARFATYKRRSPNPLYTYLSASTGGACNWRLSSFFQNKPSRLSDDRLVVTEKSHTAG